MSDAVRLVGNGSVLAVGADGFGGVGKVSGGSDDMNEEQTTTSPPGLEEPGRTRPSDGLSLADLRDVVRLRKDLTRLEDENRFMREQLGHAMAGWRDEQRRTKELEQNLKALPAPASDEEPSVEPPSPLPARTPPAPSTVTPEPIGFWGKLWQSLSD